MTKEQKLYCKIGRAVTILAGCSLMAGTWLVLLGIAFFG